MAPKHIPTMTTPIIAEKTIYQAEYIWVDASYTFRSKTKVCYSEQELDSDWTFDASSTDQLEKSNISESSTSMISSFIQYVMSNFQPSRVEHDSNDKSLNTEGILRPIYKVKDPFLRFDKNAYLVWCVCYFTDGRPMVNNWYHEFLQKFNQFKQNFEPHTSFQSTLQNNLEIKDPYKIKLGLEQEFFMFRKSHLKEVEKRKQGLFYCGYEESLQRSLMETIIDYCKYSQISITGMNAEVAPGQWEIQLCDYLFPVVHQFWLLRYIIMRVMSRYDFVANFEPKPLGPDFNGSGCHINISTIHTSEPHLGLRSIGHILEKAKQHHIKDVYHLGKHNHMRLTGLHETSSLTKFTYGFGTRHTSARIPYHVEKKGYGYFEDRRPAANVDIYLAMIRWLPHLCLTTNDCDTISQAKSFC